MSDVFDIHHSGEWTFDAVASTVLTPPMLAWTDGKSDVTFAPGRKITPKHTAAYWARVTAQFDFSEADQVPTAQFNRVLWRGLMGSKPFPVIRGQVASDTKDDDRR